MHLHAAFVPPAETVAALADLVRAQEPPPPEPPPAPPERRGLFGRRSAAEPPPAPEPGGPPLDILDPDLIWVPITDFGFVRPAIARDLVTAVARVSEKWTPPQVVLSGGTALLDEDDRYLWAEVNAEDDGVEVLRGIAREVVAAVEPLGFYCDRRQFRSRIPLATINDRTTVEHLEVVLAALDGYCSQPWTVDELSILRRHGGGQPSTPWETVPLGS